jgi:sugar O-acyltransferase (sialic acid O-acetyltransferase NeuD family)
MIIVGAGGLAIEILEILKEKYQNNEIFFFDNINKFKSKLIYNQFKVLTTKEEVQEVFKKYGNSYCIGVGGIKNKLKLINLFDCYGGELNSAISSKSFIGSYNVNIGKGSIIFPGVKISNSVSLGKACLVYYNSVITHECVIGDFCEISPSVNVLGKVTIGNKVWLGSNSTVMPKIKIGNNVTVGAMALVTKNVKDNITVVGIPAKRI